MLRAIILILSLVCRLQSTLGRNVPGVPRQLPDLEGQTDAMGVRLLRTRDGMIAPRVIIISMVWDSLSAFK